MMSSQQQQQQQQQHGDFPPNPFRSNDDATAPPPPPPSGPRKPSSSSSSQPMMTSANAPLRSKTAPATHSSLTSFDLDPHSTSFEPIDAVLEDDNDDYDDGDGFINSTSNDGFIGSGPMNPSSPFSNNNKSNNNKKNTMTPDSASTKNRTLLQSLTACCSLDSYRNYFDVDTKDVQQRIIATITHCNTPDGFRNLIFGNATTTAAGGRGGGAGAGGVDAAMEEGGGTRGNTTHGKYPDLYGPFWISATMIFFVAVTSNISMYIHSDTVSEFEYDINHLMRATSVLYTFTFLLPALLCLTLRCLAIPVSLIELICLYGYCLVPYMPVTLLCLIPAETVVWLSLLFATLLSVLLVLRNVAGPVLVADVSQQKAGPVLGSVFVCHVIFFFVLKLAFYHHGKKK